MPEGMGVGLSIARWIVMTHGGGIRAAHGAAGGAEFPLSLRAAPGAAADAFNLTTDGKSLRRILSLMP